MVKPGNDLFTCSLPRPLLDQVRARWRRKGDLSEFVEEALTDWLKNSVPDTKKINDVKKTNDVVK